MKEFLNKKVHLEVKVNDDKSLHFTAIILEVSDTHITFRDKFDSILCYKIDSIIQINTIQEAKQ